MLTTKILANKIQNKNLKTNQPFLPGNWSCRHWRLSQELCSRCVRYSQPPTPRRPADCPCTACNPEATGMQDIHRHASARVRAIMNTHTCSVHHRQQSDMMLAEQFPQARLTAQFSLVNLTRNMLQLVLKTLVCPKGQRQACTNFITVTKPP